MNWKQFNIQLKASSLYIVVMACYMVNGVIVGNDGNQFIATLFSIAGTVIFTCCFTPNFVWYKEVRR